MRKNHTLARLRQGEPALGLWVQNQSVHSARMIAAQGLFDWLLVDMEHVPLDLLLASQMLSAIADVSAGTCTPIVRVPTGTIDQIKRALDAGAHGVLVPMINTAQDAADVVRFARYPPLGERGGGGLLPHYSFGSTDHVEYIKHANDEVLVAIQIETQQAVENVDAILDTPGIDLVFIGTFDLHLSLGLTPALWSDHPVFQGALYKVIAACKARGIPYGTLAASAEGTQMRIALGFTFVGIGTDMRVLLGALHAQVDPLRSALASNQTSAEPHNEETSA